MNNDTNDGWIVVAECNTVTDASIIAGAIENEGIPTQILNRALQSALPMTFTWAPVQIVVPVAMSEQARGVIPPDYRL